MLRGQSSVEVWHDAFGRLSEIRHPLTVSPEDGADPRGERCRRVRLCRRWFLRVFARVRGIVALNTNTAHLVDDPVDFVCVSTILQQAARVKYHLQKDEVSGMDCRLPVIEHEGELLLPPSVEKNRVHEVSEIAAA